MSKIPVVFTFDKRIILGAAVTIKSMIDYAEAGTSYDIYVFHPDIPEKTIAEFEKLTAGTPHKITFMTVSPDLFKGFPISRHSWNEIVYYKIMIPELLPQYDKVIFSDVDVFFKADMQEVYNTDLTTFEFAAVPSGLNINYEEYGIKFYPENHNKYRFMTGFMVMNTKLMRQNNAKQNFIDVINKYGKQLKLFDLEMLNLGSDKIKPLPLKYITLETIYEYENTDDINEWRILKTMYSEADLAEARARPAIIHYAGKLGKPWRRKCAPAYYQKYIDMLPASLTRLTFRDIRKKFTDRKIYPVHHPDVRIVNYWDSLNYGANLTAYALQEFLQELNFSSECVNSGRNRRQRKKFAGSFSEAFALKYLNVTPYCKNLKELKALNSDCKTFLCGSDQVFRPNYLKKNPDKYLLSFAAKDAKKIAVAASFGIDEVEMRQTPAKILNKMQVGLADFDFVANREQSGVNICENIFKLPAVSILDPVFLADKSAYDRITDFSGTPENVPSVVSYILDEKAAINCVSDLFAQNYGEQVFSIAGKNLSVNDWLYAVKNCKMLITDSYHGACFAIIFNKPFLCIKNHRRGEARFNDLAARFNLAKNFIDIEELEQAGKLNLEYNADEVNKIIKNGRIQAGKWLKTALNSTKKFTVCTNCTGCGACMNICPENAIVMQENSEGFRYPEIDFEKCINCRSCQNVCPVNSPRKPVKNPPDCYALMADDDLREKSSSGGAFSILAEPILKENGKVFGAAWSDDFKSVRHIKIETVTELPKLRSSKYLQSITGDCFTEIKNLLDDGVKVFFTGTPCQVAGLNAFLGNEHENLLTADILCHGTPSAKVFQKYLSELCPNEKIENINFRDKRNGWNNQLVLSIKTEKQEYVQNCKTDAFYRGFLSNLFLRQSCADCPAQYLPRPGDLTIGDFWRIEKFRNDLNDGKGTSVLLINTAKGSNYFNSVLTSKIKVEKLPLKYALKGNGVISKCANSYPARNEFFQRFSRDKFMDLTNELLKK